MTLLLSLLLFAPRLALAADAPESSGVSGALEQTGAASPAEKEAFANAAVTEINAAVHTVEKLLSDAEREKDKNTEAIECLQRKLTPLQALADAAGSSASSLSVAIASGDSVHADQEYRLVAVALSKARDFLAEAHACVGDTGAKEGNTEVSVDDQGTSAEPPLVEDTITDVNPDPSPS